MRETANLPQFSHFEEERRVLEEDSYVDDILTSHNNLDQLKSITENVEQILGAGGFKLKPWVFSGESRRESFGKQEQKATPKTVILPNQLKEEDNKALGLGYTLEDDKLHVMVGINFSKRKRKMRLGQDLQKEEVRAQTQDPLTRRELLSQVSGLYDPVGLTTPVKQKGAILVRRAFQEAKHKCSTVRDTWDLALSENLREDAIGLFEEYAELSKVKFPRALTPVSVPAEPDAITFSDGSDHAYGAVLYLRWDCDQGPTVRLVESKAKLAPLDHKGEVVSSARVITTIERQDALRDLFLATQEGVTFPATTIDRLVVFKEEETGLLVCGGRVQAFNEDRVGVPLLPCSAWVSTLLVREAHSKGHEGVAVTLLKVRKRAWVIRG